MNAADTGRTHAQYFADEGYVRLPAYLPNVQEFNETIERTLRANVSKPIFHKYDQWRSLDDFGLTYEQFAGVSQELRVPEIHAIIPELGELVRACNFEKTLSDLLPGHPKMSMLQSLYFPFSSGQASHSDKFFVSPPGVPYDRETLCGVWLALDRSSEVNGALFGWRRSQKVESKPQLATSKDYVEYVTSLDATLLAHGIQREIIPAEAGDVIVWASDFVHGGSIPKDKSVSRRSLVLHYGAKEVT